MLNIKPSLNPIPQSLYILLSKTLLPCHSQPRPTCSRTCCLSDLPSPPLPICSSHAGPWALLQPGQAHSCLRAFAFALPSWKPYFSLTCFTPYFFKSLLKCHLMRDHLQTIVTFPTMCVLLTLLYFSPEHFLPLALFIWSLSAPVEWELVRQDLVLFLMNLPCLDGRRPSMIVIK